MIWWVKRFSLADDFFHFFLGCFQQSPAIGDLWGICSSQMWCGLDSPTHREFPEIFPLENGCKKMDHGIMCGIYIYIYTGVLNFPAWIDSFSWKTTEVVAWKGLNPALFRVDGREWSISTIPGLRSRWNLVALQNRPGNGWLSSNRSTGTQRFPKMINGGTN